MERKAKWVSEATVSTSNSSNNCGDFLFAVDHCHKDMKKDGSIVDSGATRHVVSDKKFFTTIDLSYKGSIKMANGERTPVNGIGIGMLEFVDEEGHVHHSETDEVLFAPELVGNMISVKRLTEKGFRVEFDDRICEIKYKGKQIGVADMKDNLYVLRQADRVCVAFQHNENCIHQLHRKMGHRDPNAIHKMCADGLIEGLKIVECGIKEVCKVCLEGKMTRTPFPKQSKRESSATLDLIHTDVCGPMQTMTPSKKRYIVTFIDDFSSFTIIRLLSHKSEVEETVQQFVTFCKTKFGRVPKTIRLDRSGEYTGEKMKNYLRSEGISMQFTAPYSPQQNGKAERKNRTLVEMARCMLIEAKLPNTYWGEAVVTANFIQNRMITRTTNESPYERWNGVKPGIQSFKIFGSECFVHVPSEKRRKLDSVAVEMIFLGYDENSKAYRCYNAKTNKVVISRDVKFCTSNPVESNNVEFELSNGKSVQEETVQIQEENDEFTDGTRVSQRQNKGVPPVRLIDEISKARQLIDQISIAQEVVEPKTYSQALESDQKVQWLTAMQEEIEAHENNDTWCIVDLPAGKTAIGGKWVFKAKTGADGEIERYKARYVAQGFSQKYGEDYDEVFAPVVSITTFRVLLSLAAKRKMKVYHFDAKTAFLNGKLTETIYMKQPDGFHNGDESKVCLLRRSIYGLKQAAKSWNDTLNNVLLEAGFQQSYNDPCLYSKKINGQYCYVIVYVDDLIVACYTKEQLEEIERELKQHFEMHNLGPIKHYLGIEVTKDNSGNFELCQSTYIKNIVADFGLQDAKPMKTPMEVSYGKTMSSCLSETLDNNTKYRRLIGRLLYLSVNTRPDVSASVSILAQKVSKPLTSDWDQLKRVVKYLKSTQHLKLKLSNVELGDLSLFCYADATWADDCIDRKSNSGRITFFNGGTISWSCTKQNTVATSSCEAEFISISDASKEVKWLKQLLEELHEEISMPVVIFEDNQSCIELVRDHKFSYKTKHIDTKYKWIRDLAKKNVIVCKYCPTDEMIADLLTKPLSNVKHNYFVDKCNLV